MPAPPPSLGQRLWQKWMAFSLAFGNFMSRVIFTVFYFTLFLPWGLGARLFGDLLSLKKAPRGSAWRPAPPLSEKLSDLEEPF